MIGTAALIVAAVVAGGIAGWLLARLRAQTEIALATRRGDVAAADLQARLDSADAVRATLQVELAASRARQDEQAEALRALGARHAGLAAELEQERRASTERLAVLGQAQQAFRDTFAALAADALRQSSESFLALATTRLEETRSQATAELAERQQAFQSLVAPIGEALSRVEQEVRDAERHRLHENSTLLERLATLDTVSQRLGAETSRLVDALKRPGVRGRWGELQLRRVVELAGMQRHCDFLEQSTLSVDERRLRPDVIVHLPGGKRVVVDAKVPLDAYLRALDAPDEGARQLLLKDHARQVRAHIGQLAQREYAAAVQPGPDFVVLFLPGEMFFSAALEQDPDLLDVAAAQRVIPASPTTLIALLRAVATGWQQETLARSAQTICEQGRALYNALGVLAAHLTSVGTRLRSSVEAYNAAIGSLEGNVLVKARKFRDLASGLPDELPVPAAVEALPRPIVAPELTGGLPFDAEIVDVETERADPVES
jgi:DNA recombination protein RmuC